MRNNVMSAPPAKANRSDVSDARFQQPHNASVSIRNNRIDALRSRMLEGESRLPKAQHRRISTASATTASASDAGNDLYTRLMEKKRERDARVESLRKQQMEEELSAWRNHQQRHRRPRVSPPSPECTLEPRLQRERKAMTMRDKANTDTTNSRVVGTSVPTLTAKATSIHVAAGDDKIFDRLYRRSTASSQTANFDSASTSHRSSSATSSVATGMSSRLNDLYNEGVRRNLSRPISEKEEQDRRELNMLLQDPKEFTFKPKTNWTTVRESSLSLPRQGGGLATASSVQRRPRPSTNGRIGIYPRDRSVPEAKVQQQHQLQEIRRQQHLYQQQHEKQRLLQQHLQHPRRLVTPSLPTQKSNTPCTANPGAMKRWPAVMPSPPREILISPPLRLGAAPLRRHDNLDHFPIRSPSPAWQSPPRPIRKCFPSLQPQQQQTDHQQHHFHRQPITPSPTAIRRGFTPLLQQRQQHHHPHQLNNHQQHYHRQHIAPGPAAPPVRFDEPVYLHGSSTKKSTRTDNNGIISELDLLSRILSDSSMASPGEGDTNRGDSTSAENTSTAVSITGSDTKTEYGSI
ncbi:hypothetical protein ACA910_013521 [Epithemia clementina (nom. ined.)]